MSQQVPNYRRYCLLKRQAAAEVGQTAIAAAWQAKQEAVSATSLPSTFPLLSRLAAAFYTTVEDLDGATVSELSDAGCFSIREAEQVIAAELILLNG